MAPVTYAADCASCHPLYFDPLIDAVAPHDTPEKVHAFVVAVAAAVHREATRHRSAEPEPGPRTNSGELPRHRCGPCGPPPSGPTERTAMVERLLWSKTCAECHTIESAVRPRRACRPDQHPERLDAARAVRSPRAPAGDLRVVPRGVSRAATPSDVLMPSIATCQQCHKPRERRRGALLRVPRVPRLDEGEAGEPPASISRQLTN